jgi:hypothetical protein
MGWILKWRETLLQELCSLIRNSSHKFIIRMNFVSLQSLTSEWNPAELDLVGVHSEIFTEYFVAIYNFG